MLIHVNILVSILFCFTSGFHEGVKVLAESYSRALGGITGRSKYLRDMSFQTYNSY